MDIIEARKILSQYQHESQRRAKEEKCFICGNKVTSFCNSHSVPQFVLKHIAKDGKVLNGACALEIEYVNQEDGVNRSGTFSLICRECDSHIFSDYENEESLVNFPSNRVLAEMDLKNTLQQISKRHFEIELYALIQERKKNLQNKGLLDDIHSLDVRDYTFDYKRAKKIIDKNLKSGYVLTYTTLLPYVVPIAAQSGITLMKDLSGNVVNDIYNTSPDIRMQSLHCCIFPLTDSTRIIVFHHKDDRNYVRFDQQFAKLNEEEKLKLINYLQFQYSENYFASPTIEKTLSTNEQLKALCGENGDAPNLGFSTFEDLLIKHQPIPIEAIPNFLSEQYKLR